MKRLCDAVQEITVGPPENSSNLMGPVIDGHAHKKILAAIELGRQTERIAAQEKAPAEGYYIPPAVLADLPPDSPLLHDEIFGPVLAIVRAANLDEALQIANNTDYALTGGIYSRSPATITQIRKEFAVGNLYVN